MKHSIPSSALRLSLQASAIAALGACALLPFTPDRHATAPLLDGFGTVALTPSHANAAARRLFAQGMAQAYAFNEHEAVRSFKAALAHDPGCALCAWGVAYQLGPNINNTTRGDLKEALRHVEHALKHGAAATPLERALIESLALRYGHGSEARNLAPLQAAVCGPAASDQAEDRADPLDLAYAERMRELADRFAGDADVLAIYAEAELVATRGDWWDPASGQPAGRIGELAERLEAGLARQPEHTGLNHYLIHTVDAPQVAQRAEAAADRLGALAPKSPHLLHMPAHTYAQIGRYADATRVNQQANAADLALMAELKAQNFSVSKDWRQHNTHFQWYGALMEGRGELALSSARAAAALASGDYSYAEYQRSLPMLTLLRLQRWDELLKEPLPGGELGVAALLGQLARGTALARSGQTAEAAQALAKLEPAAAALLRKFAGTSEFHKMLRSLAQSSQAQLRAELAWAERRVDAALALQAEAVNAAAAADRSEPPMLAGGAGLQLGAMQLQANRYAEAEASYRASLAAHPHSGWALQGLRRALLAQGKQAEAERLLPALERSWKLADAALRGA
ncbi:tetratricopeptide repeat protein [Paucibacter soli]|uniref:tetratricopeptide repeat protein n=1 Tax=Paucibacter soli TaxID=3133433 RepID=UPI0030A31ACE